MITNSFVPSDLVDNTKITVTWTFRNHKVGDRVISLREDIEDNFMKYVNSDLDRELRNAVDLFRKEIFLSDEVLSLRINSMFLKEVQGYL